MATTIVVVLFLVFLSTTLGQEHSKMKNWITSPYGLCTSAFLNATYRDAYNLWHTSSEEVGKYGECNENDAFGILVHVTTINLPGGPDSEPVEDHTGCQLPFRSSTADGQLPTRPWIALIKRGSCNFELKVANAYNSNASAVIVYDDKVSYNLQKMKLSPATRNMSAVFTYKATGDKLADLVDRGTDVYMSINVGSPCDRPYNLNRTSVLFVSISFIILMVISLAWLVFYYVQRFRYMHAKDRLSKQLGSAAKKALSKIPTKHVKSEDKEMQGDGECCAVCIEPFKINEVLRMLPCRHEFHKMCIDPWLLEHRTCPMCKMDILKYYGFVFTGSQESILHLDMEDTSRDADSRTLSPVPPTPEPTVVTAHDTHTQTETPPRLSETSEDQSSSAKVDEPSSSSPTLSCQEDETVKN